MHPWTQSKSLGEIHDTHLNSPPPARRMSTLTLLSRRAARDSSDRTRASSAQARGATRSAGRARRQAAVAIAASTR